MSRFNWEEIYFELSNVLLNYKDNRSELIQILISIFDEANLQYPFKENGVPTLDVCPFSIYASFNKKIKDDKRQAILKGFKRHLNLTSEIPTEFDALPLMNNMSAWFYSYTDNLGENDINNLWILFEKAIKYADNPTNINQQDFIDIYNIVRFQRMIKWNITDGLFWIRPYTYVNLDSSNRNFLEHESSPYYEYIKDIFDFRNPPDGETYIRLIDKLKELFQLDEFEENNFIDVSYKAFNTPYHDAVVIDQKPVKQYWMYAAGPYSNKWNDFYHEKIMGIGWDLIGDINQFNNKKEIREELKRLYDASGSLKNNSLAIEQFCRAIGIGDVIYVKKGANQLVGRGIVESKYIFDDTRTEYKHIRKVKWTHEGVWEHPGGQAVQKTLTNITQYNEYIQKLELLFDQEIDEVEIKYDTYTEEDFLKEVFISEEKYLNLKNLLKNKKNIIIQGPPGVGKTFSAKRLAYSIIGEKNSDRVQMIQFHQSYSYEDFIMGYRPTKDGFELKEGPFYQFCEKARNDDENDYFFIIDEINRGNLSKIFGELLMLIEGDKRKDSIQLMYRDEKFNVPNNIHLIGLMNTADRSLAMIDYALRRRFAFVDFQPSFVNYDDEFNSNFKNYILSKNNPKLEAIISRVIELNKEILDDDNLGEGFMIGHSYFCQIPDNTDESLKSIVSHEIIPLLREYWFDEKDKVEKWQSILLGTIR